MDTPRRLRIFVATRRERVPAACVRYASVDGAVPGAAVTWDHHQTGEAINLDALPALIDTSNLDGVGTTLADTDALASVVAMLSGGPSRLPPQALAVLAAASFRCDHLRPHPDYSPEVDDLGTRLDNYVGGTLALARPCRVSGVFARLCCEVWQAIQEGRTLPGRDTPAWAHLVARAEAEGRLRTVGAVLVVDLLGRWRAPVRPDAWYAARPGCRLAVVVDRHPGGGRRFVVGQNPYFPESTNMIPLLEALAAAEFGHGPPALGPHARPGMENWGGREQVGGSPWNYGSRLGVDEVVRVVNESLGAA